MHLLPYLSEVIAHGSPAPLEVALHAEALDLPVVVAHATELNKGVQIVKAPRALLSFSVSQPETGRWCFQAPRAVAGRACTHAPCPHPVHPLVVLRDVDDAPNNNAETRQPQDPAHPLEERDLDVRVCRLMFQTNGLKGM